MTKINAVIIGASGYTGVELLRLLLTHPNVEIKALVAESNAGKEITELYPNFYAANLPRLQKLEDISFNEIDVVFCCLPHATSQKIIKTLPQNLRIIDLSADFRLADIALYEKWYGKHLAPELQSQAAYGLPEICRDKIKDARIIACPGCYPTSVLLPLIPLMKQGLIEDDDIIIDSKSGVTGAGRKLAENFLFNEANEGVSAYGLKGHRHSAEMVENLGVNVTFVPHLIPMNRGIISTIYVEPEKGFAEMREALIAQYKDENFVHILPEGVAPATHYVRGTNHCFINIFEGQTEDSAIIVSVIDNLCKGSSGQAVQNMNLAFGLDEKTALEQTALFP